MNNEAQERTLDLMAGQTLFSLTEEERAELEKLRRKNPELAADESFELAAAAIQLVSTEADEEMPAFLKHRISEQADDFWREKYGKEEGFTLVDTVDEDRPATSFAQWLGWAVAGLACIALVVNIWFTGVGPQQLAGLDKPVVQEKAPTVAEKRDALMASAQKVRTEWSSPQQELEVAGDVVWSDEKQEGYMTFRGLPVNDKSKETYQLWIFDETQDEATPIDGGVFDVSETGETIIPIDPNLRVSGPKAFAVTVEKPGGVMVSKREKIVALAKV